MTRPGVWLGMAALSATLCVLVACGARVPFSPQVLEAAARVKEKSGINADLIAFDSADPTYYKSTNVVIVFGIWRSGRILTIEVAQRSDYKVYDDYAVRAVQLALPFPPPPDAIVKDRTGVLVVADFKYVADDDAR